MFTRDVSPVGPRNGRFPSVTAQKSASLKILVVEDDALMRWSIAQMLGDAGHTIVEAPNGATAIRAVTNTLAPFDVVLLDYRPSDSDDLTLLTTIRKRSPTSAVVLMTAFGTPELVNRARDLGACRVLNKPFDLHDIGNLVLAVSGE